MKYYKFSDYLKKRFGCRVHKVSIDAGFSCPNRDGTISKDGCIYCDNRVFSPNTRNPAKSIEQQLKEGMASAKKRYKAKKFIAYFQAFTNTYAPINLLKERYDKIKKFGDIVSLAIGTRPDCVNDEIIKLLNSYSRDYEVWIEYGVQTMHDKTLSYINRGHLYKDFLDAVKLTKQYPKLKICAHVIIGLPFETPESITETAKALGRLKLDGIKIHPLHIVKGTKLEKLYNDETYKPLTLAEYAELASNFIKLLPKDTVIQRITADCPRNMLAAPDWILDKHRAIKEIEKHLF